MSCLLDYRYYAPHNSISLYNDNDLGSYNNFHPLKHVTKFCFPMFLFLFSCYFVKGKVPFFSQLVTFLTCILNVCTEYFHGVLTSAEIMFVCFLVSNEQFVNNEQPDALYLFIFCVRLLWIVVEDVFSGKDSIFAQIRNGVLRDFRS